MNVGLPGLLMILVVFGAVPFAMGLLIVGRLATALGAGFGAIPGLLATSMAILQGMTGMILPAVILLVFGAGLGWGAALLGRWAKTRSAGAGAGQ